MGNISYEVISDNDGKKGLKQIADYYSMMEENAHDKEGGKRKRTSKKMMRKTKRSKKGGRKRTTRRYQKLRRGKKY